MVDSYRGATELGHDEKKDNHRSVTITINLAALRSNLAIARQLSSGSRQFATIKADAYGHGAVAVAHALSPRASSRQYSEPSVATREPREGIADGFAVVTLDEALELRLSGIEQPVLVLQGPQTQDACAAMLRYDLWPVVHDLEQYEWFRRCPEHSQLNAWLKVDTGMGRLGVQPAEAQTILDSGQGIKWMGLMTHFACADEPDNPFTDKQRACFESIKSPPNMVRSMANSAAVLAWPETRADWARPGIMLYGCNPLDRALPAGASLTPAMTVTAPVISIKQMKSGSGIGYAQSWQCPVDMPVGYVALGYRDGLPRVLDNSACVTVAGKRCPVIGRVSMDSIAIDLRTVPDARLGDLAEFWGASASIDELAKSAGTINYELLTSIRGRRAYVNKV